MKFGRTENSAVAEIELEEYMLNNLTKVATLGLAALALTLPIGALA